MLFLSCVWYSAVRRTRRQSLALVKLSLEQGFPNSMNIGPVYWPVPVENVLVSIGVKNAPSLFLGALLAPIFQQPW